MDNNKDLMYISFKLKTIEEILKKMNMKIDNLENNFQILKSDYDLLKINTISDELQNELKILLYEK